MSLGPVTGLSSTRSTASVDNAQQPASADASGTASSPDAAEKPSVTSEVQNAARSAALGAENAIKSLFNSNDDPLKGVLVASGGPRVSCGPRGGRCG